MNERFLELRKALNLSQDSFGIQLGVTRSSISNMETGRFNITDTMTKLVCSTFKVNEIWLRTGVGEMFAKSDIDDELSWLIGKEIAGDDLVMKRLLKYFMNFDETQRAALKTFAKSLLEEDK